MKINSPGSKLFLSKDYVFTVLANVLFVAIYYILLALLPVFVDEAGHGHFLAGFQNTFFAILSVVLRIYFGPMADRKGRKAMMLLGSTTFMIAPFIFMLSQGQYLIILLGRAFMALGMASFLSAASCYIAEIVPTQNRGAAIGLQRAGYSIALMIGPFYGLTVLNSPYGFTGLFLLTAVLGFFSVFLVALLKNTHIQSTEENNVRQNTLRILKTRTNRMIYYFIVVLCIGYGSILSFTALYLSRFSELQNPGVYFTYFALSGLVGSITVGFLSDKRPKETIALMMIFAIGMGMIILYGAQWNPVLSAFFSGIAAGFGFNGGISVLIKWIADITPTNLWGTALGLQESGIDVGIAIGSLLFGTLGLILSESVVFLFLGSMVCAYATRFFVARGKLSDLTITDEP